MYHSYAASIKSDDEHKVADYCARASRYLPGRAAPHAPSAEVKIQSGPKARPDINPVAPPAIVMSRRERRPRSPKSQFSSPVIVMTNTHTTRLDKSRPRDLLQMLAGRHLERGRRDLRIDHPLMTYNSALPTWWKTTISIIGLRKLPLGATC